MQVDVLHETSGKRAGWGKDLFTFSLISYSVVWNASVMAEATLAMLNYEMTLEMKTIY